MEKFVHEYVESQFFAAYNFFLKSFGKMYIHVLVDDSCVLGGFNAHVHSGILVLSLSDKSCPGLSINEGNLILPLTLNGVPITVIIPLSNILAHATEDHSFVVELGSSIVIRKDADDGSPKTKEAKSNPFTIIDGGKPH